MKITQIEVSVGRTVPGIIDHFRSFKREVRFTASLTEEESTDSVLMDKIVSVLEKKAVKLVNRQLKQALLYEGDM